MTKALTCEEQIAMMEEVLQFAEKTMRTITDLKEQRKWINTITSLNRTLSDTRQLHQEHERDAKPKRSVTELAAQEASS